MMLDWGSRSAEERESLLNDPWGFAEWVGGQEGSRRRQFRHALLFLLFPDEFEPIMSLRHKKEIVKAFRNESDEPPDVDHMDLIDLDRALLEPIRIILFSPLSACLAGSRIVAASPPGTIAVRIRSSVPSA